MIKRRMAKTQSIAVVTGDIVGSTAVLKEHKEEGLKIVHGVLAEVHDAYKDAMRSPFVMYRGDEVQGVFDRPEAALEAAVFLRVALMMSIYNRFKEKSDIRISIGIGGYDYLPETVSQGNGEAFVLSGRGLDEMRMEKGAHKGRRRLVVRTPHKETNNEFEVACALMDALSSHWTRNQIDVLYYDLQGMTGEQIKDLMEGVNYASGISERLARSGSWAIKIFMEHYRQRIKDMAE